MKEPGDRLRELRIKKNYDTAAAAAAAFGWNENTYKSHENGERGIKLPVARKYAAAFGSSASYILTGETAAQSHPVSEVLSLPLVATVAAGQFRPSDWEFDDETMVPAVISKGIPPSKQYAVRVDGPSVNKRIANGMYAICAELSAYPGGAAFGSLVHVIQERDGQVEHTIKELRYQTGGVVLMPVSDDPAFQTPLKIEGGDYDRVTIRGVVIGSYQPF